MVVRSMLANCMSPSIIRFHVVVVGETAESLRQFLGCSGIHLKDQVSYGTLCYIVHTVNYLHRECSQLINR